MRVRRELIAGRDDDHRIVTLPEKVRSTHLHVLGASGKGKSKFLEHMIRTDIEHRRGVCVIDPHGSLYNDLLIWCARRGLDFRRKLILIEPGNDSWTFAFNPLSLGKRSDADIADTVAGMVAACSQVWGGEDLHQTPRLAGILPAVLRVLVEKRLSLRESLDLLGAHNIDLRSYLTDGLGDEIMQDRWDHLNALTPGRFQELTESTRNRLSAFLENPLVLSMLSQTDETIDFRQAMDDGAVVLINLAGRFQSETKKLLGALLLNTLYHTALQRKPDRSKPFYTYVDECHYFLTGDVRQILVECRKFGLHLILAHQDLGVLREAGVGVYTSVMAIQNKMIFGGINPAADAEEVATQIFMGSVDLAEAKRGLQKPVVTGYVREWMQNHGGSIGSSYGTTVGTGLVTGMTENPDEELLTVSESMNESEAESSGSSWMTSEGMSESLVPVLEWMPTSLYSYQEQIYRAMALMVNQPTQRAYLKVGTQPPIPLTTPTIRSPNVSEPRIGRFKNKVFGDSDIALPRREADERVRIRRERLRQAAVAKARGEEPQDFME